MKVGLVGLGSMGKNHLRVLESLPSVSEILVFDPLLASSPSANRTRLFGELSALIESAPSYCVVSTPTSTHALVATELAHAGIPSLIEKPLASNLSEAHTLFEAFSKTNTKAAVGHVERFNPALMRLKHDLKSGTFGPVISIDSVRHGPFTGRISDVGVVLDLLTHDLDLASWLSDSWIEKLNFELVRQGLSGHEDAFHGLGRLANGTVYSSSVGWLRPNKERTTSVLTEGGLLVADSFRGEYSIHSTLRLKGDAVEGSAFPTPVVGEIRRPELVREEPLRLEHQAFQNWLETGDEGNLATLHDAIRVLRVTDSVLEVTWD